MSSNVSERQAREVAEAAREAEWKLPSFGKELFLGNFRPDLIHPQPRLDPAAVEKGERFLEQLRDFLESDVDPLEIERDAKIPEPVIDGLKRIGALGMKVPEEYGGLGLSQVYYNRALALAGVWHASLSTLLSAHQSIGVAEPLQLFGTEEQKRKWLPLVARDQISAFLLTEPDVGSDPARLATTENSVTRLDHVFVPEENRIGRQGDGLKIALTTLNTGRLALPAICVGMAKWATKIAREWSIERVQWGRPIGKHDAVAQKLAFIAGSAFGLEAMLDVASRLADNKSGDIRIMHLLIAREAVDQHLKVAGELVEPGGEIKDRLASAGRAGLFYSKWLPQLAVGKGQVPTLVRRVRLARAVHARR